MTALDCIIEGLERELALELELGERTVEFDRSLLLPPTPAKSSKMPATPEKAAVEGSAVKTYDFVFLHDRPLSPGGVKMMAKIVAAMGKSADEAPIVFTGEMPRAKVYIALGAGALGKWFPDERGSFGGWIAHENGSEILVSRSPEYILRISATNPELRNIKSKMWADLKEVVRRTRR